MRRIRNPQQLIISLVSPFLAAGLGSAFTQPAIATWYQNLTKPIFTPPGWVFGPVWAVLYLLMGIALYRVWLRTKSRKPITTFYVHLVFNALWSVVFFGLKRLGLALVVIVILWALIYYLIQLFGKVDKLAAKLLYPYLAWVSFAMLLNFSIWLAN